MNAVQFLARSASLVQRILITDGLYQSLHDKFLHSLLPHTNNWYRSTE